MFIYHQIDKRLILYLYVILVAAWKTLSVDLESHVPRNTEWRIPLTRQRHHLSARIGQSKWREGGAKLAGLFQNSQCRIPLDYLLYGDVDFSFRFFFFNSIHLLALIVWKNDKIRTKDDNKLDERKQYTSMYSMWNYTTKKLIRRFLGNIVCKSELRFAAETAYSLSYSFSHHFRIGNSISPFSFH